MKSRLSRRLRALVQASMLRWSALTPTQRAELEQAQRRAWVAADLRLRHPDMTAEDAARFVAQAWRIGDPQAEYNHPPRRT